MRSSRADISSSSTALRFSGAAGASGRFQAIPRPKPAYPRPPPQAIPRPGPGALAYPGALLPAQNPNALPVIGPIPLGPVLSPLGIMFLLGIFSLSLCISLTALPAYAVELDHILLDGKAVLGLYQLFQLVQQAVLILRNFRHGKTAPAVCADQHLPVPPLVLLGQLVPGFALTGVDPVHNADFSQQLQGPVHGGQADPRVTLVDL